MGRPKIRIDVGQRFGRLVVRAQSANGRSGHVRYECECDCGTQMFVNGTDLRHPTKPTRSCGCLKRETVGGGVWKWKHAFGHDRIYQTWTGMWRRCTIPETYGYKTYGGRGITVCAEWRNVKTFAAWADAHGYSDDLTIDRLDGDAAYSPDNCQFISFDANRRKQGRKNRPPIGPPAPRITVVDGFATDIT